MHTPKAKILEKVVIATGHAIARLRQKIPELASLRAFEIRDVIVGMYRNGIYLKKQDDDTFAVQGHCELTNDDVVFICTYSDHHYLKPDNSFAVDVGVAIMTVLRMDHTIAARFKKKTCKRPYEDRSKRIHGIKTNKRRTRIQNYDYRGD